MPVESELMDSLETDHKLEYIFPEVSQSYLVCIKSINSSCLEEVSFCQDVAVGIYDLCPDPGESPYRTDELLDASSNLYKITFKFSEDVTGDYYWSLKTEDGTDDDPVAVAIPKSAQEAVGLREFSAIVNLESGKKSVFDFYPRNIGCPEGASLEHFVIVP